MKEPGTHKLTEAMEGQTPAPAAGTGAGTAPAPAQAAGPNPAEVAEETRREQEARSDGIEDRDQRLTRIGRGQQTHG
jgi:hypothetical protein